MVGHELVPSRLRRAAGQVGRVHHVAGLGAVVLRVEFVYLVADLLVLLGLLLGGSAVAAGGEVGLSRGVHGVGRRTQGQILQQFQLGPHGIERLVGALGTAQAAGLAEALDGHGVRVHEQQRLHALGLRTPHTFVGATCRLGSAHEQTRGLGTQLLLDVVRVGQRSGLSGTGGRSGRPVDPERTGDLVGGLAPLARGDGLGEHLVLRVAERQRQKLAHRRARLPDVCRYGHGWFLLRGWVLLERSIALRALIGSAASQPASQLHA